MSKPEIKLLPFHPRLVKLFPEMSPIEFNELVTDIEKYGQRIDIDTWNDEIIDGKHRALASARSSGSSPSTAHGGSQTRSGHATMWSARIFIAGTSPPSTSAS
jgi:hypothetical protein